MKTLVIPPAMRRNFLLLAEGSGGDVFPLIAIGKALGERGHTVRFAANSYFQESAETAGLDFIATGSAAEARAIAREAETWQRGKGLQRLFRAAGDAAPRTYELIREQCAREDTILVATFLVFGARLAQEKLGIPLATVHPETVLLRSRSAQPGVNVPESLVPLLRPLREGLLSVLDRHVFDPPIVPQLNAFRRELGLPPISRILNGWVHSPQLVIGLFPDWFVKPQPDWPRNTHLTGFPLADLGDVTPLDESVDRFLQAGDPPLIFTLGSAMPLPPEFVATSLEVCRILGRRGIFLTPFPEGLPAPLPEGVICFPYIPLSTLLPRAAALVHHGGIGTVSLALAAGTPQLAMPTVFDQPVNAAHLRALGAGDSVRPRLYKPRLVATKLRSLLSSGRVRAACQLAAQRISQTNCLRHTSALLEQLASPATRARGAGGD